MEKSDCRFRPRLTARPWGFEVLWACTSHYAAKILFVRAGEALSLPYRRRRLETYYALAGELDLVIQPGRKLVATPFIVGTVVEIAPGIPHGVIARTDGWFVELSTPELDDGPCSPAGFDRSERRIAPRRQWRSRRPRRLS